MNPITTMRAPDYLRSLETAVIERAYADLGNGYTRETDAIVAGRLEFFASLHGIKVAIPASTLGRERSSRGLVAFKSPRGAVKAEPLAAPAPASQPDLPNVQDDGAERAGWALVKKQQVANELLASIRDLMTRLLAQFIESSANPRLQRRPIRWVSRHEPPSRSAGNAQRNVLERPRLPRSLRQAHRRAGDRGSRRNRGSCSRGPRPQVGSVQAFPGSHKPLRSAHRPVPPEAPEDEADCSVASPRGSFERLQGYPDDWTRYGLNSKGKRYELKDSPRYRMVGNGVTRTTGAWIGRRIAKALRPDAPEGAREETVR